jgi:metal-responsive CopG/Arc/MetJ family transcriptional regulator
VEQNLSSIGTKVETSISLSEELLHIIEQRLGQYRSQWIEMALRTSITQITTPSEKNRSDLNIINKNAAHLNEEALDVLSYQVDL